MRTHIAWNLQQSAFERPARDAEWGIAILAGITDVGTQFAQGVYQYSDRAMLHALRSCNRVRTSHYTQIGSHKAHRCSGSLDIDFLWHVAQGIDDDLRIITVAQVLGQIPATAEGIDDESSVRDAFRCR